MHQPIPPISAKPRVEERPSEQPDAARRPGVPARVQLVLLIAFVVAFAGASLPIFHRASHDAPVAVGKVVLDPDGDDPRTELLYHWQDPRFAQDEQHHIIWMANGLALLGIYCLAKRISREARR